MSEQLAQSKGLKQQADINNAEQKTKEKHENQREKKTIKSASQVNNHKMLRGVANHLRIC